MIETILICGTGALIAVIVLAVCARFTRPARTSRDDLLAVANQLLLRAHQQDEPQWRDLYTKWQTAWLERSTR